MIDPLALSHLLQYTPLFFAKFGRNDDRDGLPDCFRGGVPEYPRGAGVP